MKKTSQAGLKLIESSEGLQLKAYQDVVGVWTIGYGHTGPEVREGLVISAQMAESLLKLDISKCEIAVNNLVLVPITQEQFDALVDFSFNLGTGALKSSSLLRKLNHGDYDGAAAEFLKWDHAGGKQVAGLTKRRQAEKVLFESGDTDA